MRTGNTTACQLAFTSLPPATLSAQWLHYPAAGAPTLPNGKPNLNAPAPRTYGGRPDPSGIALWIELFTMTVNKVMVFFRNRVPFVVFPLLAITLQAQWLNFPTPGTPRTPDGKPNLTAPAPRTSDRKPDLSGVWMHEPTPLAEARRLFGQFVDEFAAVDVPGMEAAIQIKYGLDILVDFRPEEALIRPAAVEQMRRNQVLFNSGTVTGCSAGYIVGFPQAGLVSEPIKIVQAPRLTMILYEAGSLGNMYRQIYTDGRALPTEYSLPAYLGYSVGHWEGDTFVVETAGFNDKTTLDALGHPHSDALRVTERFHRRDFGHLDVEMTFDDPKMYTKPFTVKIPHNLVADGDIFEMFCENEKDVAHLPKP